MSDLIVDERKKKLYPETIGLLSWIAVIAVLFVTALFISAPRDNFKNITVEDSTGKVDEILIEKELKKMNTYKPIDVFVYVKNGSPSDNLNEDTLNYVRDNHPDMISGDKWANGRFIISVNVQSGDSRPGSGQVGTYYGEDIKVGSSKELVAQKTGYSSFQETNWSQGIINVAQSSSGMMAQPIIGSAFFLFFMSAILILIGLVWFILTKLSRRFRDKAVNELDELTQDVDSTIRQADNVFVGQYVERIKESSRKLLIEYTDMLDSIKPLTKLTWKNLGLNFIKTYKFSYTVDEMSEETELVKKAITLYEKDNGWESVWNEQTQETRDSIDEILSDNSFWIHWSKAEELKKQMILIDEEMVSGQVDVDEIFQKVDKVNESVSSIVRQHMADSLHDVDNDEKRDSIESHIDSELSNKRYRRSNIFRNYSHYTYYTPAIYYAGYSSGVSSYNNSQSSSSSGYGGSGGGFSGSGSSSSF